MRISDSPSGWVDHKETSGLTRADTFDQIVYKPRRLYADGETDIGGWAFRFGAGPFPPLVRGAGLGQGTNPAAPRGFPRTARPPRTPLPRRTRLTGLIQSVRICG